MDRPYGISDFAFPNRWDRESGPDLVERAGQASRRDREQGPAERERGSNSSGSRGGFDRSRTIYRGRHREYSLREAEVRTLTDLGKFRVVPEDDLARFGYQGNCTQMESDVRDLTRQGLVERRTIEGYSSYSTKVLTLTKNGHRLLERAQLVSSRQATYHGIVKPKEARHDADLYRLYQKVSRETERGRGRRCKCYPQKECRKTNARSHVYLRIIVPLTPLMVPPKAGRFIALNLTYSERINRETGWCKFGIWRTTDMPLRYEDVSRFAREHGNVKGFAEKSAVTLLKSGDIDSVAFFEKDAVQFEHKGKSYERVEFEKLVESKSKLIAGQE